MRNMITFSHYQLHWAAMTRELTASLSTLPSRVPTVLRHIIIDAPTRNAYFRYIRIAYTDLEAPACLEYEHAEHT